MSLAPQLQELSADGLDWGRLLHIANCNRVSALLAGNLKKADVALPSESLGSALQDTYARNREWNEYRWTELLAVLRNLTAARVAAVSFKGPVLAHTAYSDLGARQFGDLDVLIRRRDWSRAKTLLLEMGYRGDERLLGLQGLAEEAYLGAASGLTFSRTTELGTVRIDLQHKLSVGDWVSSDLFWEHAELVQVAGAEIRTVCREPFIAYLCFHGTKHLWARLQWMADVAAMLEKTAAVDYDRLFRIAAENGMYSERTMAVGLDLASSLLDSNSRGRVLAMSRRDRAVHRAVLQVSGWVFEDEEHRLSEERRSSWRLSAELFFWRLPKGAWAKTGYYLRSLRSKLRPTHAEVMAVPLPRWLRYLYHPLRVFRLTGRVVTKLMRSKG